MLRTKITEKDIQDAEEKILKAFGDCHDKIYKRVSAQFKRINTAKIQFQKCFPGRAIPIEFAIEEKVLIAVWGGIKAELDEVIRKSWLMSHFKEVRKNENTTSQTIPQSNS